MNKEKEKYRKSNSDYIHKKRMEELSKEEVIEYYEDKRRVGGWLIAFLILLLYVGAVFGAFGISKVITSKYDALEERTELFGKQMCENINEQYFGYWARNGNIQIACETETFTFLKQE